MRYQWFVGILLLLGDRLGAEDRPYDPLSIPQSWKAETVDLTVKDDVRSREIPLRVYFPKEKAPAPVVLFSHGLGGSREGNPYLGQHWSARGYIVVFLQHHGSDAAVWKDAAPAQRMAALRQAANLQNTLLRFKDVTVTIDQLERWNKADDSPMKGRLNLEQLGMSGHSFGAVTTQGVSGQRTPRGEAIFTDARIKAAISMSPSGPRPGADPKAQFGNVTIPWLLMTGTNDTAIVGDQSVESRLAVFPALSAGKKYELVLDGAEHEAFGDYVTMISKTKRNPNHHKVILALSTAFWDAYLRQDAAAKKWLDGDGPASVMEKADRWQKK